jgi:O-antigen/teichoic acid export membrane protein
VSLKRNVVANYLGQGWRALMGLAFVPLYIKYLGIESYGLIGLFAILQAWLELLDLGMRPALGREMARFTAGAHDADSIRDLLRTVEVIATGIATVLALGIWAGSRWIASDWLSSHNLPTDMVARAIALMGAVVGLRFIEALYVSSLVGLQRQELESVVTSTLATVRGVGALAVLAWVAPTITAYFVWQAGISIVTVMIFASLVHRVLPPASRPARFSWRPLLAIWRFAAGMTAISVLAILLTQVDKILMTKLLPLQVFAYYALAAVVANGLFMVTAPISAAFYPRFTELATLKDEATLRVLYHKGSQMVAVLTGSAAVILILFANRIVLLWTRNPALTEHVAPLVAVLAFGTMLNALMAMPYQLQLAYGWTTLAIRVNITAVCVLVPIILWAVPAYGAIGAAWAWVLLNLGYVLVTISFMHRRLLREEKWRWYRQDVALPIMAGALVGLMFRFVLPSDLGKAGTLTGLLIASAAVLITATLTAPALRHQLAHFLPRGLARTV